jgi:ubiquinone/menaquinone biosynthesis C-methylase UbiE
MNAMYREFMAANAGGECAMTRTEKGYKGVGMEGSIARHYALNTAKDAERHRDQARMAAERTPSGGRILEVAPGPGYTAIELAKAGYEVVGLDSSQTFVEIARKNADEAGVGIDFRLGNSAELPFEDGEFDSVLCCAAFKNFAQPVGALREFRRVLKPGGRALVVDLRKDVSQEAVAEDVKRMGLGTVGRATTRFILGTMLPRRAYTKAQFAELLAKADVSAYDIAETPISLVIDIYR